MEGSQDDVILFFHFNLDSNNSIVYEQLLIKNKNGIIFSENVGSNLMYLL